MEELVQALKMMAALAVTLVVPPLVPARRLAPRGAGWMVPLLALALGCVSQGVLGFFWDRLVRGPVRFEVALYYGFWIVATLLSGWMRRSETNEPGAPGRLELRLLVLIVAGAALVRSLHPLAHAALGQSDAYSHLQFIRWVVADGMIHNQIYPPSFTWIMALPAATFGLDPYWLARFGGAFWGAGLTFALFALARCGGLPWAGLCAAALAAFCPAWMPLLKTGVGVFANQLGLFLLPLILLFYIRSDWKPALGFLVAVALALASAVPMMLISLMPVLLADRLLASAARESRWWRNAVVFGLALVPAFVLLFWQAERIQGIHRDATMEIVTGGAVKAAPQAAAQKPEVRKAEPPNAHVVLVKNFLSVKRKGYGNPWLNLAGGGLALVFLAALALGIRRKNAALRLLGVWGVVTSIQAGTGVFQFTGYQREGWSLLLATAWLGGVIASGILSLPRGRPVWRGLAVVFFAVCFLGALKFPPGHAPALSAVEDEIIDVARRVADRVRARDEELPLTIVMRPFTGFCGDQGDPLAATIGKSPRVATVVAGPDVDWSRVVRPGRQYLVMMDLVSFPDNWSPGLFANVQPEQVSHYLNAHRRLFQMNRNVREWLDSLPSDQWTQEQIPTTAGLFAVRVQPIASHDDH